MIMNERLLFKYVFSSLFGLTTVHPDRNLTDKCKITANWRFSFKHGSKRAENFLFQT